jgi:translation initiation factor 2B subunit (eIF-2B alpha/beta/delta family)
MQTLLHAHKTVSALTKSCFRRSYAVIVQKRISVYVTESRPHGLGQVQFCRQNAGYMVGLTGLLFISTTD